MDVYNSHIGKNSLLMCILNPPTKLLNSTNLRTSTIKRLEKQICMSPNGCLQFTDFLPHPLIQVLMLRLIVPDLKNWLVKTGQDDGWRSERGSRNVQITMSLKKRRTSFNRSTSSVHLWRVITNVYGCTLLSTPPIATWHINSSDNVAINLGAKNQFHSLQEFWELEDGCGPKCRNGLYPFNNHTFNGSY